jgi:hypothetical protein
MKKYSYAHASSQAGVIVYVNGKQVAREKKDRHGSTTFYGEPIHEYLNRAGQDGWRVVGFTSGGYWIEVLLEREIE